MSQRFCRFYRLNPVSIKNMRSLESLCRKDRTRVYLGRLIVSVARIVPGSSRVIARAFPYDRPCRFQIFEATETIVTTGTTIWKPGFRDNILSYYLIMMYYHSPTNNIKQYKRSVSKLHDKAKHFKIKA